MKLKFNSFILVAVFAFILSFSINSFAQNDVIAGGYGKASIKNADVKKAVNTALKTGAKKEKATITLVKIKQAQSQVVAGVNYKVCLEVNVTKAGKTTKKFVEAVVYRNLKNVYKLTDWKLTTKSPC